MQEVGVLVLNENTGNVQVRVSPMYKTNYFDD